MSLDQIQDRLQSYRCQTAQEEENAIKEMVQEVCLSGLSRSGFFKKAAFQGGTCLRILYHLPRFSEDLDFVLKKPNPKLSMTKHLNFIQEELRTFGFDFQIEDRSKADATVKKAFLKNESWGQVLSFQHQRTQNNTPKKIKVKIEIDTNPPGPSGLAEKTLDFPFPFQVTTQDLPSLFAGKSHALLCRKYVKGRDWYDFLWYAGKGIHPNFEFLELALRQQGPYQNKKLKVDLAWLKTELAKKIKSIEWSEAVRDVRRFLRSNEISSLKLWSEKLFLERLERLR